MRGLTDGFQDVPEGARDDAVVVFVLGFANHGMGFTTSGLAIGEDGSVIAGQYILDEIVCCFGIDGLLLGVFTKDMVKGECFYVVGLGGFDY